MVRRIAVVLCCLLSIVAFLYAEEATSAKPIVAVPDFLLLPKDKFDDKEMSILASSMVSKVLEEKYTVLSREDLLKFLAKKKYAQIQLFSDREVVESLKELNCTALVTGRLTKKTTTYTIELGHINLTTGKVVLAKSRKIKKPGDFPNFCKEMTKEILLKLDNKPVPTASQKPVENEPISLVPAKEIAQMNSTLVTVTTNKGAFAIRFFPSEAPLTCRNFISLCKSGFYSDALIHRIIPNRIVQMGIMANGEGVERSPDIPNEFNRHPHVKGTVAMARNPYIKDYSSGYQFYISLTKLEKLDRNDTVFGQVVSGMDIVELIGKTPVGGKNPDKRFSPDEELKILTVKVETTETAFKAPPILPKMITIKDKGVIVAEVETSMGNFKMRFYPRKAPKLVQNFLNLSQKHFYDGLIWHRVIDDFIIQAGDPSPSDPMVNEAPIDIVREMPSDLKHIPGSLSMAKRPETPSDIHSTSQFFICLSNQPAMNGKYAVFGQVFEGFEVVKKISQVDTDVHDMPLKPVVIKTIRIVNLGDVKTPWVDNSATELVPATMNTPYSKLIAVISTDMGDIHMKFYAKKAPKTVANFVSLARKGFYDGMYIHRVAKELIIQMGDPTTNGQETPPNIPDELVGLSNYKGTVAMAKKEEPNSATCQFFINIKDNNQYDGKYSVFAVVTKGLDIAKKISLLRVTNANGLPNKKVFFSIKLMTKK